MSRLNYNEKELVAALNKGDDWSYRVLMTDYVPVIGKYLFKMKNDKDMVDEALSEMLVVVTEKGMAGELVLYDRVKLLTLLIGIGRRKLLKLMGKDNYFGLAKKDMTEEELAVLFNRVDEGEKDDSDLRRAALWEAFKTLYPDYQYVLEAYYFYGMSMEEIAEELYGDKEKAATVRKKKYKAMLQLKKKVFALV